jgi:hypothetical protein
MVDKLSFGAGLCQTVIGTPVAIVPATHYIQFSELDLELNQMMENAPAMSGLFTTEPKVAGNSNVNVKGKIPLISGGSEAIPQCDTILKSMGFTATVDASPANGSRYIYTRSIGTSDMGIAKYYPNSSTTSARILTANSIMFNSGKITLDSGKVPMLEFSGVGLPGGASSVLFESTGTITKPTQTKIPQCVVNDVSATFFDTSYELYKATFEIVNKIEQKPLWTGCGFGRGEIGDEESKFTCSMLSDNTYAVQPINRLRAATTGAVSVSFGSVVGRRITIAITTAQIESVKDAKQGDLLSHDLSGTVIDNVMTITFNSDLT